MYLTKVYSTLGYVLYLQKTTEVVTELNEYKRDYIYFLACIDNYMIVYVLYTNVTINALYRIGRYLFQWHYVTTVNYLKTGQTAGDFMAFTTNVCLIQVNKQLLFMYLDVMVCNQNITFQDFKCPV